VTRSCASPPNAGPITCASSGQWRGAKRIPGLMSICWSISSRDAVCSISPGCNASSKNCSRYLWTWSRHGGCATVSAKRFSATPAPVGRETRDWIPLRDDRLRRADRLEAIELIENMLGDCAPRSHPSRVGTSEPASGIPVARYPWAPEAAKAI
jgi:hypothetical protein